MRRGISRIALSGPELGFGEVRAGLSGPALVMWGVGRGFAVLTRAGAERLWHRPRRWGLAGLRGEDCHCLGQVGGEAVRFPFGFPSQTTCASWDTATRTPRCSVTRTPPRWPPPLDRVPEPARATLDPQGEEAGVRCREVARRSQAVATVSPSGAVTSAEPSAVSVMFAGPRRLGGPLPSAGRVFRRRWGPPSPCRPGRPRPGRGRSGVPGPGGGRPKRWRRGSLPGQPGQRPAVAVVETGRTPVELPVLA
jgi:hypothetical protein